MHKQGRESFLSYCGMGLTYISNGFQWSLINILGGLADMDRVFLSD